MPFGVGGLAGLVVGSVMTCGRRLNGAAPAMGRWNMDAWWWVPIALTAWFVVAVVVGLWLGPVLRHWSQAYETTEPRSKTPADHKEPDSNGQRAA